MFLMSRTRIHTYLLFLSLFTSFTGCIEEVEIERTLKSDIVADDILVVEATITNELKTQQVSLSRARSFANDSTLLFEKNAIVEISTDSGDVYQFEDQGDGNYLSKTPFAAEEGIAYQLSVTTSKGEQLQSDKVVSIGESNIDDIYAERIISDSGEDGMAIFVDSSNPSDGFNNYRYTYEETYKIIAPNWTSREFEIIRPNFELVTDPVTEEVVEVLYPDVQLVPRKNEEQICFNTVLSNQIILSDGNALDQNSITRNQIRFISRNNPILSHRYSILVRQFLQSPGASDFYRTLLQFSQSENIFTEIQPGLIEGNISAVNNTQTVVIGFFDVASLAERRLFFNYTDFFPNEELPPYFGTVNCKSFFAPPLGNPEKDGPTRPGEEGCPRVQTLTDLIQLEEIEYFGDNDPPDECQGPFLVTQRECGDCTALGSNIVPEFWIDG